MARESVKILQGKLDVESLISQLNAALSEEWLAYYQYWVGALVVEGAMRADCLLYTSHNAVHVNTAGAVEKALHHGVRVRKLHNLRARLHQGRLHGRRLAARQNAHCFARQIRNAVDLIFGGIAASCRRDNQKQRQHKAEHSLHMYFSRLLLCLFNILNRYFIPFRF